MNTRLAVFPYALGMSSQNMKSGIPLRDLERIAGLYPMIINYLPYLFVCIDLLNVSSNRLWWILIYFIWIDTMLYSWISVDLKNTIYYHLPRLAYSKWLSVTMATSDWPIKWSVFWLYIVCVFLWCMGNIIICHNSKFLFGVSEYVSKS